MKSQQHVVGLSKDAVVNNWPTLVQPQYLTVCMEQTGSMRVVRRCMSVVTIYIRERTAEIAAANTEGHDGLNTLLSNQ